LLPPGIGVVLVFYPVAGHVSSVLYCTNNVALSGGTGVELALQFTAPLLLRLCAVGFIGFHFLLLVGGCVHFLFQVVCWWGCNFLDGLESC
jgi:hypothetical protein